MICSGTDPVLSAELHRDLNQEEKDVSNLRKKSLSVLVTPVDPLTVTDERIDIRTIKGTG